MVSTRSLETTPDEAVELMAHHLMLAAIYFEPTTKDEPTTRLELERILTAKGEPEACAGALAFFDSISASYKAMDDGDE